MAPPLAGVTEETLAAITKAQTAGIFESTGIYSYDLSNLISLIPVVTPWRDMVARVKSPDGNPYAIWRAILNLTNSQPDMSMGFDYAANEVQFEEQDFQARYKPTGYSGLVTQDAYDLAYGYADPYAVSTFNTLNQVLIGDDRKLMGAQSFALAAAAAPTLTGHSTGGTITASSAYVGVAGRTGSGYYYGSGNSQGNSAEVTGLSGTTNSITATVTSLKGAVAYDWFYSANGTTWYYYTTTTTNAVTITTPIVANNALPSATTCPDLSTQWKGATAVPTYNASADNGQRQRQRLRRPARVASRRLQRHRPVGPARHRHRQPGDQHQPRRRRADPDRRHHHRDRGGHLRAAVGAGEVLAHRDHGQRGARRRRSPT